MSGAFVIRDAPEPDRTPGRTPGARTQPAEPALHPVWQRFGRVHSYLLDDPSGLVVIDALGDGFARPILDELQRLGRSPGEIRHIVLTHAHLTHVKGAAALKRISGARVHAPAAERDVIEGRRPSNTTTWIPRRPFRVLPQQYGLNVSHVLWRLGIRPGFLTPPPVFVDHPIERDGQPVGPLFAIRTPGHTPGSTSFYWPAAETLFAGDALVTWPRFELGWKGLTEDYPQNVRSIANLVGMLTAHGWRVRTLATGHGPPLHSADVLADLAKLVGRVRRSRGEVS